MAKIHLDTVGLNKLNMFSMTYHVFIVVIDVVTFSHNLTILFGPRATVD